MAGVPNDALLHLKGFPSGVNNIAMEGEVPTDADGNPSALRVGENIILSNSGKASRRDGQTLRVALTGAHSLYANKLFPWMAVVSGTFLYGLNNSLQQTVLKSNLIDRYNSMSYDVAAGSLYYSNGRDFGRVSADGVNTPWCTEMPGGQPTVSVFATGGGLQSGTYQLAITYLSEDLEESGATLSTIIDIAEGQGIQLANIPQPSNGLYKIRIYASPANGDVLYMVADLPSGTTNYLLGVHTPGRAIDKQFLSPLPAGHIVRYHNGRLHVARGRVHHWSEAMHYGLTKLHESYVSYNANITLMESAGQAEGSGMFIAAGERTYYVVGADPKEWQRSIAYPYGAVPNSALQVDVDNFGLEAKGILPIWLASNGQLVMGTPGGKVIELHQENFVGKVDSETATLAMRDYKGIHQLIAVQRGGGVSGFAASDTAEAEVWRDGVRIA